ncbi:MAG TPA: type II toxin-antitoxin system ParD family antitoxin [Aurantimonas coralicida]|uniref:Type II toxin-antitoxin system ParD family antitoxin n=2 Tax=root TaxID=1 RepID=A0A9C9NES9_9HYPH|nr:type II toxin-antitoxin system ParD family antitoxin [Aurantimonas coralicida]HEU00462.1 type II toxin-antitoxin system ParD family antitoxin [Aurantimonas coralicida]
MSSVKSQRLGEPYDAFVDQQVEIGEFADPDDVVRAGLRLLERRQRKIAALRAAIQEGFDSGEPQPFDLKTFLRDMHSRSDALPRKM